MEAHNRLVRETNAARDLLAGLQGILGDDTEALVDTVEGETSLLEAIQEAVNVMDDCDILLTGIKKKEEDLAVRKKQTENRRDRIRAHIEQALVVLEIDKPLRLPTMTLSLKKVPRAVVVTDEAAIPSEFWTTKPAPPPSLNKSALKEALTDGKAVKGAELDNGGQSLAIRRK